MSDILGALTEAQQNKIRGLVLNKMDDKAIAKRLGYDVLVVTETRIALGLSKRSSKVIFDGHEDAIRDCLARGYTMKDIVEHLGMERSQSKATSLINYLKKKYGSKEEFILAYDKRKEKEENTIVSQNISKKIVARDEERKLMELQLQLAELQFGAEAMEKIECAAMAMVEIYNG